MFAFEDNYLFCFSTPSFQCAKVLVAFQAFFTDFNDQHCYIMTIVSKIQYTSEVTYTEESTSYSLNKHYHCGCKNCTFFKSKNFKRELFYGIIMPLLLLVPGAVYIWKYEVKSDKYKIKFVPEIELPTAFELKEYRRNTLSSFKPQLSDIEEINGASDDKFLAVTSNHTEQEQAFYCMKEACHNVCNFHEVIKNDARLWAGRGLIAFFVYITLLAMLILCATYSNNKNTFYK